MKSASRTILVAGMGTSPAVLTETVWAFAYQKNELMYVNYGLSCFGLVRNRKVAPNFSSALSFIQLI